MSINDRDDSDEYESIFSDSEQSSRKSEVRDDSRPNDEGGVEMPRESSRVVDVEEIVAQSISGDVNSDIDIEDGIFVDASPSRKPSKTTGILGLVVFLAVVGAGGFVYVSNPEIIGQLAQNLFGSSENTTEDPSEKAAGEAVTVNVDVPSPESVDVQAEKGGAKTASVQSLNGVTVVSDPTDSSDVISSSSSSSQAPVASSEGNNHLDKLPEDKVSPVVPEAAPVPHSVVSPPVDLPVKAADSAAKTKEAGIPVAVGSAPSVDVKNNVKGGAAVKGPEAKGPEAKAAVVALPDTKASVSSPAKEIQKVPLQNMQMESGKAVVGGNTKAEKEANKANKAQVNKALENAKLDAYFDSPNGKMLKDIPAPSMNPEKGSGQSVIIVNKTSNSPPPKGHKKTETVSIKTMDLDEKIIAANRALKLQRYDAAKDMYDELYQLNPRDGRILMGRAVLLQKMGQKDDAIAAYEDILTHYPDNTEAVINLAGLVRETHPEMVLSRLSDLQQKYPENAVIAAQLGVTYASAGKYPDAFHYLGRAATLDPSNPQHYYNMAVISERAGDIPQAISNYEKALEVDAIYGEGRHLVDREKIYDRLAQLRGH